MRIFYASDTTPNSFINSNIWKNNLYSPLIDLGHEVIEFKYNLRKTFQNLNPVDPLQKKFIKKNRPKVSMELLKQIKIEHKKNPIDLFFSYFFDACILPETIGEINSLGIKTINWYCNASYQLNLVSEISPQYDYCLVPEKFRLNDYKAIGANPIQKNTAEDQKPSTLGEEPTAETETEIQEVKESSVSFEEHSGAAKRGCDELRGFRGFHCGHRARDRTGSG